MFEVQKQMARFNRRFPQIALDPQAIRQSIRARLRHSEESLNGINVNPRLRHLVAERVR